MVYNYHSIDVIVFGRERQELRYGFNFYYLITKLPNAKLGKKERIRFLIKFKILNLVTKQPFRQKRIDVKSKQDRMVIYTFLFYGVGSMLKKKLKEVLISIIEFKFKFIVPTRSLCV